MVFDSLVDLVRSVSAGSSLSAFVVQYRNRDYYSLADSEEAAVAAVAVKLGMQVGLVPLDLVVQAARVAEDSRMAAPAPAELKKGGKARDMFQPVKPASDPEK